MASTVTNPPPPSAPLGSGNQFSASVVNSFRVAAVVERLQLHLASDTDSQHPKTVEYYNLLLSLARGIDYAVANNDVPNKVDRIPPLVKEICCRKSDTCSQALVMVLMISVKNACKIGWFPEKERQELSALIDDVGSCFYSPRDVNIGTSESLSAILTIFRRFYPQLKLGEILTSLVVKPGYGAFVSDFHISKNTAHSPDEKIRLFVAQTDNMETSACIISPPQVNFLLNGKAVDRRTNIFVDSGPQMPTYVTSMLKYGTNLLQAVGQFNDHYVIALAFMSVNSQVDSSGLKDYVSPTATAPDSDSDIIEGPSKISLNCPISRSRIQLPVKGQSCKHLQCFDFSNFVGINLRRPAWRCPHCNQHVCYTDLRIDQSIAKVLKEVGSDVTSVMISADGSWKAVMESDDDVDIAHNRISVFQTEAPERGLSTNPPTVSDIMDLTGDDDMMDADINIDEEDTKPPLGLNNSCIVNQGLVQPEDGYHVATATSNAGFGHQVASGGAFEPTMLSNLTSPAITDSISLAFSNREVHGMGNTNSLTNLQLLQSQLVNYIPSNRQSSPIPVNVSRIPTAVQALPVQRQAPNPLQRPGSNLNAMTRNSSMASPSVLPQAQQQFSRSMPTSPPSSFHLTPTVQATNRSASPSLQQRPVQHQAPSRTLSGRFTGFQNHHLQQTLNHIMPPPSSQSPTTLRYPLPRAQTPSVQTPTTSGAPQSRFHISSQQANAPHRPHVPPQVGISRPPGIRVPSPDEDQRGNNTAGVQPSPRGDGSGNLASEQNWRPVGRMRGSLTGRPFADEISQLVIQPTQATRPSGSLAPSNPVSSSLSAPPHLRASMSNSRNTSTGNTQTNL